MDKPDIEIGYRAAEAVDALPGKTVTERMRRIGLDLHSVLSKWRNGAAPSAKYLQALAFAGIDMRYILTGSRSTEIGISPEKLISALRERAKTNGRNYFVLDEVIEVIEEQPIAGGILPRK